MHKKILGIGAATAAALLVAVPATAKPDGQHPPSTRAEVATMVAAHFTKADSNKDGFITESEVQAMAGKRMERMKDRGDKRADRAGRADPAAKFAKMDTNKDGKLTRAEVDAAHSQWAAKRAGKLQDRADKSAANGDQRASKKSISLFDRADTNKDGVITQAELAALPRPDHRGTDKGMHRAMMGKGGPMGHMLSSADSNKDGKVSLAEAQAAALARFDRVDTNHDGKISPDEHKAARDSRRAHSKPAS